MAINTSNIIFVKVPEVLDNTQISNLTDLLLVAGMINSTQILGQKGSSSVLETNSAYTNLEPDIHFLVSDKPFYTDLEVVEETETINFT